MEARRVGKKDQLKIIKADGSCEQYLHTKVMGTISRVLEGIGRADIFTAEQLADIVTYYLYEQKSERRIRSCDVFSIVKIVLSETGNEDAAIALNDYYFTRKLRRSRIEVIDAKMDKPADIEKYSRTEGNMATSRWNKTSIVDYLTEKFSVERNCARAIAAMVEEKILAMGLSRVSRSLIKQLVLTNTALVLRADRQTQIS